jgi:hypothetical protein
MAEEDPKNAIAGSSMRVMLAVGEGFTLDTFTAGVESRHFSFRKEYHKQPCYPEQ